jgi:hypothetical protein
MQWISRIIILYVTSQNPEKFNDTICMFNLPEKVHEGTKKGLTLIEYSIVNSPDPEVPG